MKTTLSYSDLSDLIDDLISEALEVLEMVGDFSAEFKFGLDDLELA